MIAGLLSILGSSAVGSLLGGIFALFNRKADMSMKQLELTHETAKWAHELAVKDKDLAYAREEAAGKREVAIIETDGAIESERMKALAISHEADKTSADELKAAGKLAWVLVIVSALTKAIRPITTIFLAGTAIYINLLLVSKLTGNWETLSPSQQYDAALQAFSWLTGQAAAVIGYWFVARGSSK